MSLSATVSKKSVTGTQENINLITFTLVLTDTAGVGFTKDYDVEYRKGDTAAGKVAEVTAEINGDIAQYKAQQAIFNSAQLTNAVNAIQGGIIL